MKKASKPVIQVSRSGETWHAAIDGVALDGTFETEGAVRTAIKLALLHDGHGKGDRPPS